MDLEATWRRLMTPLGFGRSGRCLMLIRPDGTPLPVLIEAHDREGPPTTEVVDHLVTEVDIGPSRRTT